LTDSISQQIAEKPQLLPLLDALIDVAKNPQPQLKLLSVLGAAATPKPAPKSLALSSPVYEVSASIAELEKLAVKDNPAKALSKKKAINSSNLANEVAPSSSAFDWAKLLEYTRQNFIALFSVLSKCSYELAGNELTLYTGSRFYKNKLDDTKYTPLLAKCLQDIGIYGLTVHTLPTTLPPKDSQAAAITAIMGGGEEVSIDLA
jgi:hypothetical protein